MYLAWSSLGFGDQALYSDHGVGDGEVLLEVTGYMKELGSSVLNVRDVRSEMRILVIWRGHSEFF